MPIEAFPDIQRHGLCVRCKKWHELHEGKLGHHGAAGPIGAMRQRALALSGDESAIQFMCLRCLKVRRYTQVAIIGVFVVLVVVVLVLERLGYLQ